ncbi:hypothetical protein [Psittacicella gerlachiana]|uniref:Uncharacterized protein n=1 Tax=Psittacicella gerlachiana TaxID=2028574 RepID=A0A3A1YGQ9_9GAMM|nr:hypothetical protein [Psittacicella gerlachiana]RIY37423.1 hypothetical protein CKF59_01825 [Psittacicella gerlachiana]
MQTYSNIQYSSLPAELQNKRLSSTEIKISFSDKQLLQEFVNTYIDKFIDQEAHNPPTLDLNFIDVSEITNLDFLFSNQIEITYENIIG